MRGVARALGILERGLVVTNQAALALMMMVMATLVFVNVVSRYVFGDSLNWSEEVSRYLMIWVTYLGAGLAMREGKHVAIEYGQGLLPRWLQPWFRGLLALVILGFMGVLMVVGVQFSEFAWRQRSPVMQWPMGAVYLAIPIGALLFALHFLAMIREWITAVPGFEEPEEVAAEDAHDEGAPEPGGAST